MQSPDHRVEGRSRSGVRICGLHRSIRISAECLVQRGQKQNFVNSNTIQVRKVVPKFGIGDDIVDDDCVASLRVPLGHLSRSTVGQTQL